jgi:ubiquinone/menaquinone biosynthesis C-methylase UbiE
MLLKMKLKFSIWHHFLDGMPIYLARHYWWAYLWRPAIWFFDHQPIINAILFGQYRRLLNQTLHCLKNRPVGNVLQLTCVYGCLTPSLVKYIKPEPLHLIDVSTAQLKASRKRLSQTDKPHLKMMRMNAEKLGFRENSFATVIIFFLMHEMPEEARHRTLAETLRILAPGGRLVITEYGEKPFSHWIYHLWPLRILLLKYEPFLNGFWHENLTDTLKTLAEAANKKIDIVEEHKIFNGFYRVLVYELV